MQFSTLLQLALVAVAANGVAISINSLDLALSTLSTLSGIPSGIPPGAPSDDSNGEDCEPRATKAGGFFAGIKDRNLGLRNDENQASVSVPTGVPTGIPSGVPTRIPSCVPSGPSSDDSNGEDCGSRPNKTGRVFGGIRRRHNDNEHNEGEDSKNCGPRHNRTHHNGTHFNETNHHDNDNQNGLLKTNNKRHENEDKDPQGSNGHGPFTNRTDSKNGNHNGWYKHNSVSV